MAVYRFRLEKVLDYRKDKEEAIWQHSALLQQEVQRCQDLLNASEARKAEALASLREMLQQVVEAGQIVRQRAYVSWLDEEVQARRRDLAEARRRLEECRSQLLQAHKDRRVLERLKERSWEAFCQEDQRQQQKALDEAAANGFLRQTALQGAGVGAGRGEGGGGLG